MVSRYIQSPYAAMNIQQQQQASGGAQSAANGNPGRINPNLAPMQMIPNGGHVQGMHGMSIVQNGHGGHARINPQLSHHHVPHQKVQQSKPPSQPPVSMPYRGHPRNEQYLPTNPAPQQQQSFAQTVTGQHPVMRPQQPPPTQTQQPQQPDLQKQQQQHANAGGGYQMRASAQPQGGYRNAPPPQNQNNVRNASRQPQGAGAPNQLPQQQQTNAPQVPVQQQQQPQQQHVATSVTPQQQPQPAPTNYIPQQIPGYMQPAGFAAPNQHFAQAQHQLAGYRYYPTLVPYQNPALGSFVVMSQGGTRAAANMMPQNPIYQPQMPPNMTSAPQNMPVSLPAHTMPQQSTMPRVHKKRSNAIPIRDPNTLQEVNLNLNPVAPPVETAFVEYSEPPVVSAISAMADGPDITPKQNLAKKKKPIEAKPAAQAELLSERESSETQDASSQIHILQDQSSSANYVRAGDPDVQGAPAPGGTPLPDLNDLPKYEGVPDPVPAIASALSCDAKSFEPKNRREASYSEPTNTAMTTIQENNNILESVVNIETAFVAGPETTEEKAPVSSDTNKNLITPDDRSLSPSDHDETDKSISIVYTRDTTEIVEDTTLDSNFVNNNNTIKQVTEEIKPTLVEEVPKEPSVEPETREKSIERPAVDENKNEAEPPKVPETAEAPPLPAPTEVAEKEKTPEEVVPADAAPKPVPIKSGASRSLDKALIEYDKDQWSPANPDGKKKYSLSQLRQLGASDLVKKPDLPSNLSGMLLSSGKPNMSRMGGGSFKNTFQFPGGIMPPFASSDNRGNFGNIGNHYVKRGSSQQNRNSSMGGTKSGSQRGGLSQRSSFNKSMQQDVKLHEAENAWKPRHLISDDSRPSEERETEDILKKFRSIMNKLTPENFNKLLEQIMGLRINTQDRLRGVIELVFEKAIAEPNYSTVYADICKKLVHISVETDPNATKKSHNFKVYLLNQCQTEFEKHKQSSGEHQTKSKEIEDEPNPEKRKKLREESEEQQYKIRHRAIGTVRFIGELYKFDMLNDKIMLFCINLLLDNADEDSLECLCKLLSTVGKTLESKKKDSLIGCFDKLKAIANRQSQVQVSSRIRFAIQDVIELRDKKWQPRRVNLNPKTMDQIKKEAEMEQRNIEILNYQTSQNKRDNRDDRRGGSMHGNNKYNNKDNRNKDGDQGWITPASRKTSQTFDIKNIRTNVGQNNQTLGPSTNYKDFLGQSQNRFQGLQEEFQSGNEGYSGFNQRQPQRQNSRENSRNRTDMNGPSRSFQAPSRQSTSNAGSDRHGGGHGGPANMSHHQITARRSQQQQPPTQKAPARPEVEFNEKDEPSELELDKIKGVSEITIGEFVANNTFDNFEEFKKIPRKYRWVALRELLAKAILDWKEPQRVGVMQLCVQALQQPDSSVLTVPELRLALKQYFDMYSDFEMDCKKIGEFTAAILGPLLHHEFITFRDLLDCSSADMTQQGHLENLLVELCKFLQKRYTPDRVRKLWEASKVGFERFLKASSTVESFIGKNNLQYIIDSNSKAQVDTKLTDGSQIQARLQELLTMNKTVDVATIKEWIDVNVADTSCSSFIRAFTTAVIEFCILPGNKFDEETRLNQVTDLFRVYMDNSRPEKEMQALYAIQAIIRAREYPNRLLSDICIALLENCFVSREGFLAWKEDVPPNNADREGKGVCLKSLTQFFTSLAEQSDESDDGDDAND